MPAHDRTSSQSTAGRSPQPVDRPGGRVLVVEPGHTEAAIAAVRALAAGGWEVELAAPRERTLAGASRAVSTCHPITAPNDNLDRYVADLNALIDERRCSVVLPGSDTDALALSLRRDQIDAPVPFGSHRSVHRSQDKLALAEAAEAVGLGTPRSKPADRWLELPRQARYVVKAQLHSPLVGDDGPSHINGMIADREEVEAAVARIRAAGGEAVVQEHVDGTLMSVAFLADRHSRIVGGLQQVSETTWPPEGGVATRAESVRIQPELFARVQDLFERLGWSGLAQLQFLRVSGRGPLLIDFNGRFYLSLALAEAVGQNLAAAWASQVAGLEPELETEGRAGVRWQWLEGDVRRALRERRGGLVRDLAGTARYSRGAVPSTWRWRDPGPALAKLGGVPPRALGWLRRRRRRRTG